MKRIKISKLHAAVVVALGMSLSWGVQAALNIDKGEDVALYAKEIKPGTAIKGAVLAVTGTLGAGTLPIDEAVVPIDSTRYLRFEVTGANGVNMALANITKADGVTPLASVPTEVSRGSTATGFFVIYAITVPPTAAEGIRADSIFTFNVSSITIKDTNTPIRLSYSVHTNDVSASQGMSAPQITRPVEKANLSYVNFAQSLVFNVTPTNLVASVEKDFWEFLIKENSNNWRGSLGKVELTTVVPGSGTTIKAADGTDMTVDKLLGVGSQFVVAGDMMLLQRSDGSFPGDDVTLNSAPDCSGTKEPNTGVSFYTDASTAVIPVTGAVANKYLCLQRPDPKNEIKEYENYRLWLGISSASYQVSELSAPLGKILRDGTVLEAPYFTFDPSVFRSRFMISHFGGAEPNSIAKPAAFSIKLRTDGGKKIVPNTAFRCPYDTVKEQFYCLEGNSLQPKQFLQINADELVAGITNADGTPATGPLRGSAVFTFVAPNKQIQGVYQTLSYSAGDTTGASGTEVTSIPMLRPGGGDGQ